MLSLVQKNEDEFLNETRTIIERSSIPPGINSIELPPFSDVSLKFNSNAIIIIYFHSLKHFWPNTVNQIQQLK